TFNGGGGMDIQAADAFVAKFNADGSLGYATYLGTLGNDYGKAIAVDSSGAAYVVGSTDQAHYFPTTPGAMREASSASLGAGFVTKLDPTGSALVYSTLLNGSGSDIALDPAGNAFIVGGGVIQELN